MTVHTVQHNMSKLFNTVITGHGTVVSLPHIIGVRRHSNDCYSSRVANVVFGLHALLRVIYAHDELLPNMYMFYVSCSKM